MSAILDLVNVSYVQVNHRIIVSGVTKKLGAPST